MAVLLRFWIFMKSLHGINQNAMVCQERFFSSVNDLRVGLFGIQNV